jgi:hypothetical protein
MPNRFLFIVVAAAALAAPARSLFAQREPLEIQPPTKYDFTKLKREKLGRGVIAVRMNADEVFVTWRYLSKDVRLTSFNVYRDGKKLNEYPVSEATYFIDKNKGGGVYTVKPIADGKEIEEDSASSPGYSVAPEFTVIAVLIVPFPRSIAPEFTVTPLCVCVAFMISVPSLTVVPLRCSVLPFSLQ